MPAKIPIDIEELRRKFIDENMTYDECSQYLGVSKPVIQRTLRKNGIRKSSEARWLKIHQTCLERYGSINPFSNKEIQQKLQKTIRERYGVDNVSQSSLIMEKKKQTSISNFGVPWYTQTEEYKERSRLTSLGKRGRENVSQEQLGDEAYRILMNPDLVKDFIAENPNLSIRELADKIGCHQSTLLRRLHEFDLYDQINHFRSVPERKIAEYLQGLGVEVISTREIISPLEIDMYCPTLRIGIEYNGDYWHSSLKKSINYHEQKNKYCYEKGIFLYYLYEHEIKQNEQAYLRLLQILVSSNSVTNKNFSISYRASSVVVFNECGKVEFVRNDNVHRYKMTYKKFQDPADDFIYFPKAVEYFVSSVAEKGYEIDCYLQSGKDDWREFQKMGFELIGYLAPSCIGHNTKYEIYDAGKSKWRIKND